MAKYSTECKLKVVQEYHAGRGSYKTLSKLYHVSRKSIEEWVKAYQAFGDDGLRRSRAQQTYTFEFKCSAVECYDLPRFVSNRFYEFNFSSFTFHHFMP